MGRNKARDAVRRQGKGMSAAQVDEAVAEAAVRKREAREQLWSFSGQGPYPYAPDPQGLAELWEAKHAEWRRVEGLMGSSGWATYDPKQDTQGSAWAQERAERRSRALEAHAAFLKQRREAAEELRAEVWLSAGPSRQLRAVASRVGLAPERVLALLAERVIVGEDGAVSVSPFVPSR
ncbi:hypothetical protein [Streptomyces sp. NPDC097640]|uniref:hypothetical protein n=1 Tax=Streptomyces sp. NPDC097640 TaxID=3157229 RepID=UPI0033239705